VNELNIPQFNAVIEGGYEQDANTLFPGYPKAVAYACKPRNRYQKWMREKMGDEVEGHYTRRFCEAIIERSVPSDIHVVNGH
jgi:hypothetical protein